MLVGVLDADLLDGGTRHPNLALMKISAYHKKLGDQVNLVLDYSHIPSYEKVYISKVFSFTNCPEWITGAENCVLGGTGFFDDGGESLSPEIEHSMPDYHLYDKWVEDEINRGVSRAHYSDYLDYSIGFATRGCFRKCSFCVNKKYDRVVRHALVSEFFDETRRKIYLWDDNILAYSDWEAVFDELDRTGRQYQFRQGLDIRMLTDKKAARLARSRYSGDFIFAFDHIEDADIIQDKLRLWRRHSAHTTKLYLLCAFKSQDEKDIEELFERIRILMTYGCVPYVMRYDDYKDSRFKGMYIQIARWANQPNIFKKMSFREFCEANQKLHKTPNQLGSSMRALREFESDHPQIAAQYFDLKFQDLNQYDRSRIYGRRYSSNNCEICKQDGIQHVVYSVVAGTSQSTSHLSDYLVGRLDLTCFNSDRAACVDVDVAGLARTIAEALIATPIEVLVTELSQSGYLQRPTQADIPQFSNLNAALAVPGALETSTQECLSYRELGQRLKQDPAMLGNDLNRVKRVSRTNVADNKFGENHGKLATALDLAVLSRTNKLMCFSGSPMGAEFTRLSRKQKDLLLARLILRIPIVQQILCRPTDSAFSFPDLMNDLGFAESTIIRRSPNVKLLLNHIASYSEPTIQALIRRTDF